jgi:hypothetical protein
MYWLGYGLAGVIATLVMDVAGGLVRSTGLTRGAPPQLIGRFFMSVFRGHLTTLDPSLANQEPLPLGLVLLVHYSIGVTLALLLGLSTRILGAPSPRGCACILFGVGTTVLPAFWMFPAMGFGLLGLRGPQEMLLLRTALVNHLFFGVGLAVAATWFLPRFP